MRAVAVSESSQVGEARRVGLDAAVAAGFDVTAAGRVALVATELVANILRHGSGGEILFGPWNDPTGSGLQVLALDRGPGMAEIDKCLRDGYSSGGTPGTGLGAVRRQAQDFAIHAAPGGGTAILARLAAVPLRASAPTRPLWGAVAVPRRGETECGDAWAAHAVDGVSAFILADGLGHGPDAAAAAQEACRRFLQAPLRQPGDILESVHMALRPTRGAAVAVVRIGPENRRVLFAGVGNISAGLTHDGELRRMVSHNGTAGHQVRRIQQFEHPCPPGTAQVMHSDGLASSWWPPRQPGLFGLDAQDQTRIATAVSEIARNAFVYGGGGRAEILFVGGRARPMLLVSISDTGPGIANLDAVLGGSYRSSTGMGLGLVGASRLSDHFAVHSVPGRGTRVELGKLLPPWSPAQ